MKGCIYSLLILLAAPAISVQAGDVVATSGRISLRGVANLDQAGADEDPSLTGRLEVDARPSAWLFHSLVEGGWDGAARDQGRDGTLLKNFTEIYQDYSPFAEFKELYLQRGTTDIDCRIGIQRFAWGRLDEFPVNDLLNPWEYNRFLVKPLEERKIGVPSVSIEINRNDWATQLVWVPWFVPYRLPEFDARWSVVPAGDVFSNTHDAQVIVREPDLPARTLDNGSIGGRVQHSDQIDWALNFFHGYDPHPVFKTTILKVTQARDQLLVDLGLIPSFEKITTLGADGAIILGDWSLRVEAAYTLGKIFNVRQELWGYPTVLTPGEFSLNPVEVERNTLDYGIGADYRLIEDWLLTLQAQQTVIFDRPDTLYDKEFETILWINLKVGWLNQRMETNLNIACNPEHGATMIRPSVSYVLSDTWKISVNGLLLNGPPQSLFGRYAANDQVEMILTKTW